jgi:formate dehydrogenase assembly factor FdhD
MLCGPDGCACCQLEFLKTADENGKKRKKQKSFSTKELSSSRTQQKSTIYMFKTTYCRYVTYPWKA